MKPSFATTFILCLLSLVPSLSHAQTSLAAFTGREVVEVRFKGADIPSSERGDLLPQREGQGLAPGAVRDGIRNLYRTGRFKRVNVFARESGSGVILLYEITGRQYLSRVLFEGNLSIRDGELLSRTDLSPSEELSEERLFENARKVLDYYVRRGFLDPEVTFRVESDAMNRQVVVFQVREGPVGFVSDVLLEGNPGMSRVKLLSVIASMPGERLDERTLRRDVEKITGFYKDGFFLTPTVKYSVGPDPGMDGGMIVTFFLERGPFYRLEIFTTGLDSREADRVRKRVERALRKVTGIREAMESAEKQVVSRFHGMGYPFAAVTWEESQSPSETLINMTLDAGDRVFIESIRVGGIQGITEDQARDLLGLQPDSPFIRANLETGVRNLEEFYYRKGFLTAGISVEPLELQPSGDGRQVVNVGVAVREGGQSLIGNLEIRSDLWDPTKYLEITGLRGGDPYFPEAVQEAREDILTWLSSMGHLYANVAISEPERREENVVDLFLSIEEGPLVKLGRIIITGNENVKSEIIRLALDLDEGEVLTLEKILKAQERLYDLGVMNSVEAELVNPGEPAERKDLIVTVSERHRYVVGFKVGYGSEDKFRGEAAVTHRNVGGKARSLTLRGKKSTIESRTSLLYRHPWFSSRPIDFSASLSDVVEERESYSRDAYAASLDFTRKMSERTEVGLGYVFEGLRLFDVSPGARLSPDDEGKTDVAAMIWEIIYDSRDDILDPWSGLLADFRLEAASRGLGSAAEYLKYELASHRYFFLGKGTVLAGLLRLGFATPYGQSEEVIISKRFFLGGQNSVRGYALDGLGPKDAEGDPIGGDLMVNGNVEIRFPLVRTFGGVCFLDSGSVWFRRGGEGFHLRSSMGAGLRWSSPIGPLSLDYGYKLNPDPEDPDDRYRWHLSIGHAF